MKVGGVSDHQLEEAARMVIKCCLGILRELAAKFELELHIVFVPLEKNNVEKNKSEKILVGNSRRFSE